MKSRLSLTVILLLFAGVLSVQSQTIELSTGSSRAQRHYQKGESAYISGNMEGAKQSLLKAVKADDEFIEAWLLLGDVYHELELYNSSRDAFKKAVELDEKFFPGALYFIARLAWEAFDYEEAALYAVRFLSYASISSEMQTRAQDIYERASFALWTMNNPVDFDPVNLGQHVNTVADEYINAIRLDDSLLFFTRRYEAEGFAVHGRYNEHFFISTRDSVGWQQAQQLHTHWQRTDNMGALSISADGLTMFFAACGWPEGYGSCDLYTSQFDGINWSLPRNLGSHINTGSWESQPSISADGTELYFVSRRPGGQGGSDIWLSHRLENGSWSRPVNLGDQINTPGNEMAPYIHPDGMTLYFSSDGHIGLGGADLFLSRRDETGRWQEPINLGYPINTPDDEINIIVSTRGDIAYMSAVRDEGYGSFDIYTFELAHDLSAKPVSWLNTIVTDIDSGTPLVAEFSLVDLAKSTVVQSGRTAMPGGSFLISLPSGKEYALHIQKEGYLFYSEYFELTDETESRPFLIQAELQPVRHGSTVVLNNIFFDLDQSELKPESFTELVLLADFLKSSPDIVIELGGHTDNIGSEAYNLDLSQRRALAVRNFLTDNEIHEDRILVRGYGASKPVADNETEAGRALNRRTEMRILGEK